MNAIEPIERTQSSKGVPIWLALSLCLLLAVLGLAALGFLLYSSNSEIRKLKQAAEAQKVKEDAQQLEKRKGQSEAKLVLAENQQQKVLAQIGKATTNLTQLLAECDAVRAAAAALRTNEAGRKVALHPSLVNLARRFYENSLTLVPPESEIVTQLENARRMGRQVQDNLGKAYEPPADFVEASQQAAAWSDVRQSQVKQVRQALDSLVRESEIKFTRATVTPESPTLADAIAQLNEREAAGALVQTDQTVSAARTNVLTAKAEADAQAMKTRAEADAAEVKAKADRYAEEVRRKLAEEQAAKEREWQAREASLKLEEQKNKIETDKKAAEARKLVLRQKASDPSVLAKLTPFTARGHVMFRRVYPDAQPYSLAALQSSGALKPDMQGMAVLVGIAIEEADKERPRWKLSRKFWVNHAADVEQVKEAQALLIELGDVLVEMGKLQP